MGLTYSPFGITQSGGIFQGHTIVMIIIIILLESAKKYSQVVFIIVFI